ncbi:hypothetical protein NKH48_13705 [Mesorhizobium sp. M1233]|uniref:hypothetical protein n=1 Tax=Mesorhizobium sp. M1233 TaxID=2957072 RepID=UPI00333A1C1D
MKRYCQCANSKTNPCIVCGLPKFIDPEWLKCKIEEDGDEGEIGAGFELFTSPTADRERIASNLQIVINEMRERGADQGWALVCEEILKAIHPARQKKRRGIDQ